MAIIAALGWFCADIHAIFVDLACGRVEQFLFGKHVIVDGIGVCVDECYPVLAQPCFRQPETDYSACERVFSCIGTILGDASESDEFALCGFERHGGVDICGLCTIGMGVSWLGGAIWARAGGVGIGVGDGIGVCFTGDCGVVAILGLRAQTFPLSYVPQGDCGRAAWAIQPFGAFHDVGDFGNGLFVGCEAHERLVGGGGAGVFFGNHRDYQFSRDNGVCVDVIAGFATLAMVGGTREQSCGLGYGFGGGGGVVGTIFAGTHFAFV